MWKQLFSSVVPSSVTTNAKKNEHSLMNQESSSTLVEAPRGLRRVIEYLENKRSKEVTAEANANKKVPSYVVEALGPGWTLRGGLGSGAYAKVFEATWIGDNRNGMKFDVFTQKNKGVDCAIKVMRDVDMESWEISRRFVRELLILRRLRAVEGVVSLYGCRTPKPESTRHKRDLYLFFEACLTDFRQLTKMDVFLTFPDARRLLKELLMAIAHMHASDIIHRDIKPANLLLHADGTLKVCDFGLARVVPPNAKSESGSEDDEESASTIGTVPKINNQQQSNLSLGKSDVTNTVLKKSASKGMIAAEIPPDNNSLPQEWMSPGIQTTLHPQAEGKSPNISMGGSKSPSVLLTSTKKLPPDAHECKETIQDVGSEITADDDGLKETSPNKPISRSSSKKKVAFAVDGDGIDEPGTSRSAQSFTSASVGTEDDSSGLAMMSENKQIGTSYHLPRAELRRMYTEHVVTRWYRAPELVLLQPYNGAVDVWAAACVFAECFLGTCAEICPDKRDRRPLFPGRSCYPLSPMGASRDGWHQKNDQLQAIFNVRGTPNPHEIEALENDYRGMKNYLRRLIKLERVPLGTIFPAADPSAIDLLEKMLAFSPDQRASVAECLRHEYLRSSNTYPPGDPYHLTEESLASRPSLPPLDGYGDWSPASSRWSSNPESRPSTAALGPAMSQLEDDEAWERVAQHEADADMSRVLWKLVDCFPSELAPDGGLVGDDDTMSNSQDNDDHNTLPASSEKKNNKISSQLSYDDHRLCINSSDPGRPSSVDQTGTRQRSASSDAANFNNQPRNTSFLKRRASKLGMLPSQWRSNFLDHRNKQRAGSDTISRQHK